LLVFLSISQDLVFVCFSFVFCVILMSIKCSSGINLAANLDHVTDFSRTLPFVNLVKQRQKTIFSCYYLQHPIVANLDRHLRLGNTYFKFPYVVNIFFSGMETHLLTPMVGLHKVMHVPFLLSFHLSFRFWGDVRRWAY